MASDMRIDVVDIVVCGVDGQIYQPYACPYAVGDCIRGGTAFGECSHQVCRHF